jgi:hypothetical protein
MNVDPYAGIGLHWGRILAASLLPLAVALPAAALAWRRQLTLTGYVVGLAILLVGAITFASMEFGDAFHYRLLCEAAGTPCRLSSPSDFIKISTYGIIGFVQIGMLFLIGLRVEERARLRDVDPPWRQLRN